MQRAALISPCGAYRYTLFRGWAPGPLATFVMCNPSTADADVDDPTIRKCIGFARRWGFGSLSVVNLFAFRATDPAELKRAGFPSGGSANDLHILEQCARAERVVLAWGGAVPSGHKRIVEVRALLARLPTTAQCLGRTMQGEPRHPLMLAYSTALES